MVDREDVDYHPSSGSGNAEDRVYDSESSSTEQSVGDVGATTFDPKDAEGSDKERYRELRKRHHGHFDMDGEQEMNDTDIAYDARMVCNRLELTDVQQARSLKTIKEFRESGREYEITIMAAVSYVLNEDGRWVQRRDDEHGDPLTDVYYEILDGFDIEKTDVRRVRSEIADEMIDIERL
jgi:hypothetical protein